MHDISLITTNIDTVLQFQADGGRAIFGDATRPEILQAAGIMSGIRERFLSANAPRPVPES